jgi:hypothetical protein
VSIFNLDNYEGAESISLDTDNKKSPQFVVEGTDTTKRIYHAVIVEYDDIVLKIKAANKKIEINQRKIVASRVANKLGLDKSTLTTRRQPDNVQLIGDLNDRLSDLYRRKHEHKKISGAKLLKRELEGAYRDLKNDYEKLREQKFDEYIQSYIDSSVLNKQRELSSRNSRLERDLEVSDSKVALLEERLRDLEDKVRRNSFKVVE